MTMAPWARSALIVGRAATIRLSSVILPSARGTLKSTRTKTRLPAASRSRMVSLFILTSGLAEAGLGPMASHGQRPWLEPPAPSDFERPSLIGRADLALVRGARR